MKELEIIFCNDRAKGRKNTSLVYFCLCGCANDGRSSSLLVFSLRKSMPGQRNVVELLESCGIQTPDTLSLEFMRCSQKCFLPMLPAL